MVSENDRIEGNCAICDKVTKTRCSACQSVFYCSVEHQKSDWSKHKNLCHPFKIESNEVFGRYLIATKDIKAGEIVLKEKPIIFGPSQTTPPVCAGCLNKINEKKHTECERCGWLVCQKECQENPGHMAECQLTQSRGDKVAIKHFYSPHPAYQAISVIRALMLKETNPEKYEKLLKLESHDEERKKTEQWEFYRIHVAEFIHRFFKCESRWSIDEIMKMIGVLQINGHEIPLTEPGHIAVYDLASMIEHSCYNNVAKSFTRKGEILLWAPNPIKKGERLSICYSDTMWGTMARQAHLKQTKLFMCECVRCKDVTEMGTNFSALKCFNKLCDGLIVPENNTDKEKNVTKCKKCEYEHDNQKICDILKRATEDLSAMEKQNEENCIKYLDHYSKFLSPDHYLLTEVRISLGQVIGQLGQIQKVSDERLNLKMTVNKNLLKLIEKVAPAEARLLGIIHFELHAALAEIGRRGAGQENPSFKAALEESYMHAEKTVSLLQHEPALLPEGKICRQAKINADSLKIMLLQAP